MPVCLDVGFPNVGAWEMPMAQPGRPALRTRGGNGKAGGDVGVGCAITQMLSAPSGMEQGKTPLAI